MKVLNTTIIWALAWNKKEDERASN